MASNTKPIITDVDGNPIAQYYNPDLDQYEAVVGSGGGNAVILYNKDGTVNNSLSLIPILDKLSQLTGTVIDEETRKSNELQRIEFYNQLVDMLNTGQLKGDKGDTGLGLEFDWQGTSLGVRVQGDVDYIYVDLRGPEGPQGPPGSIENLTKQHVVDALEYTPIKTVNDELPDVNGNVTIDIPVVDINGKLDKSGDTIENYREKIIALTGLTPNVNLSLANVFKLTLEGATTLSISNPSIDVSQSFTLYLIQGAAAQSISFPASIEWANEQIPDLSTPNKKYRLLFDTIDGGVTWHGSFGGAF